MVKARSRDEGVVESKFIRSERNRLGVVDIGALNLIHETRVKVAVAAHAAAGLWIVLGVDSEFLGTIFFEELPIQTQVPFADHCCAIALALEEHGERHPVLLDQCFGVTGQEEHHAPRALMCTLSLPRSECVRLPLLPTSLYYVTLGYEVLRKGLMSQKILNFSSRSGKASGCKNGLWVGILPNPQPLKSTG